MIETGGIRATCRAAAGACVVLAALTASFGCVAGITIAAWADDGSVETVGGAVRLMKDHGSIRMVSEVVRARVSPEKIEVDCIFVMRNEGSADTVLVGFPDDPWVVTPSKKRSSRFEAGWMASR
jgi:hypothetical protein